MNMKVKTITGATALALGIIATGASAAPMFIDLASIGDPGEYFFSVPDGSGGFTADDGDDRTANFTEFGFSQLLATSIYDFSDFDVFGAFEDTNIASTLAAVGVGGPNTSGPSLSPAGNIITLVDPESPGQVDLDDLSPLTSSVDDESFGTTWQLLIEYSFTGNLTAAGPDYTGGTFEIFFDSLVDNSDDQSVLFGTLTGSRIQAANLDLFFTVDSALDGFLWVEDADGDFVDAASTSVALALDTNVNPPVPTANQLLLIGSNAIRQTTLDGSVTAKVPAPGVLSLVGLGLVGLGAARRRKAVTA